MQRKQARPGSSTQSPTIADADHVAQLKQQLESEKAKTQSAVNALGFVTARFIEYNDVVSAKIDAMTKAHMVFLDADAAPAQEGAEAPSIKKSYDFCLEHMKELVHFTTECAVEASSQGGDVKNNVIANLANGGQANLSQRVAEAFQSQYRSITSRFFQNLTIDRGWSESVDEQYRRIEQVKIKGAGRSKKRASGRLEELREHETPTKKPKWTDPTSLVSIGADKDKDTSKSPFTLPNTINPQPFAGFDFGFGKPSTYPLSTFHTRPTSSNPASAYSSTRL